MATATRSTARRPNIKKRSDRSISPLPASVGTPAEELVPRTHLVRRLTASRGAALAMIVAPAGYGKSTLLVEWARHDDRPFVWMPLGDEHNEPLELAAAVGETFESAGAVTRGLAAAINDANDVREARGLLRNAVSQPTRPSVLVLDDAQLLHAPPALDILAMLIDQLPGGSQVALASRTEPALPVGRLRAHRKLFELRASDLVMTRREAGWLARVAGLELDSEGLDLLVQRTEGWPAALYLAVLTVREELDPLVALGEFTGDDRAVADYIREELLTSLSPSELEFLCRASLLDRLSGPMSDYVLEREDSAGLLRRLSRLNVLLVPLDRTDKEYRFHRLLAQMLRAELRCSEPARERALHARASEWHAQHGDAEHAVEHAVATGDPVLAGSVLWSHAAANLGYGRNARLRAWLSRFSDEQLAASPTLALTAAASELIGGNRNMAEHWLSAVRRGTSDWSETERQSLEAGVSVLEAAVARDGISAMAEQAAAAYAAEAEDSPWRAVACLVEGISQHLTGNQDAGRRWLEEGARRGAIAAPAIQVLCLAQLALLAIDRDDWDAAELLAARAKAQVERTDLGEYPTSALVYAVSAEVQARIGRVDVSREDVREAQRLLEQLTDFTPWHPAECCIALARAALRLGDVNGAEGLLADAAERIEQLPEAVVARGWLEQCSIQADLSAKAHTAGGWSLTTAELRVLQFLPTHLSFPEIAERLYVSANTVKTHTRAVYRKLDASSRGEAVMRATEAGLLDAVANGSSQI